MTNQLLSGHAAMTEREATMLSPLRLAYVGDAVHDLFVRTGLAFTGEKAGAMHLRAVGSVNATAQAHALEKIAPQLTGPESDIVRRGRNAHAHHTIPKRAKAADYKQATGLEALLGYLYLTGQNERLLSLYTLMTDAPKEDDHGAQDAEG